ncbi:ribosome biogenesis protein Nop16 [Lineolata rhizophorae]|uniref:Nucleolar protein 16 n=1 Tax=Lineolata rhizophorae TaxID=578093 RepID=A0A6A6PEI9_9PEZI|nr:ribosome biogenesis protein Nop16 [Lineolata rhizophorae]
MGRELQKRKNRSSVPKVRRKPKSKKKVVNHDIIAEHWDKRATLAQNYRRLGLTARLKQPTGGIEPPIAARKPSSSSPLTAAQATGTPPSSLAITSKPPSALAPAEVRVERDPETGAILRVLDDDGADGADEARVEDGRLRTGIPPERRLKPLPGAARDEDDEEDMAPLDPHQLFSLPGGGAASVAAGAGAQGDGKENAESRDVLRKLEMRAASGVRKKPRHQSEREKAWCEALVERHGEDYRAMFWDRELNVWQQSEGDIKRRVKKWKESQGV